MTSPRDTYTLSSMSVRESSVPGREQLPGEPVPAPAEVSSETPEQELDVMELTPEDPLGLKDSMQPERPERERGKLPSIADRIRTAQLREQEQAVAQAERDKSLMEKTLVPGEAGFGVAPLPDTGKRRTRLKDYQLDVVAMQMVEGVPTEQIADAVGTDKKHIDQLVITSKTLKTMVETYRERVMTAATRHRFRMLEMLDDCHAAIDKALTGPDIRLARDTALDVIDRVVPRPVEDATKAEVNIVMNNPQVQIELAQAMQNINVGIGEMVEHLKTTDGDKHVLLGDAALPTPEVQLNIDPGTGPGTTVDADFDPVPIVEGAPAED